MNKTEHSWMVFLAIGCGCVCLDQVFKISPAKRKEAFDYGGWFVTLIKAM
jgi:hypothetical protein